MTILNKGVAKQPRVVFVGVCSELVDIDKIQLNENNEKTVRNYQGDSQKEQKDNLYDSIVNSGLNTPISVYENSNLVIGGHNRYRVLKETGCKIVPVSYRKRSKAIIDKFGESNEIDPNDYTVLSDLAEDNTNVDISPYAKYELAKSLINAKETELKREASYSERKREIKSAGQALKTFGMFYDLEYGYYDNKTNSNVDPRPDLLAELREQKDGKTVAGQHKSQLEDHKTIHDPKKRFYPRDSKLESALKTFNWNKLTKAINTELAYISKREWFSKVPDRNFKSAASHHIIVHSFVELFNSSNKSFIAEAELNGSRFDVSFKNKKGDIVNSLEVKTTLNPKGGWVTGNEKYGYVILFQFSDEMDRCFLMNAYLDREWTNDKGQRIWKAAGQGNLTLGLADLYRFMCEGISFFNIPYGDLYAVNGVAQTSIEKM